MKNIERLEDVKRLEQLPDGTWIARYGFRYCGQDASGKDLVTFTASEYPSKPTIEQIKASLRRYAASCINIHAGEAACTTAEELIVPDDISDYMTY